MEYIFPGSKSLLRRIGDLIKRMLSSEIIKNLSLLTKQKVIGLKSLRPIKERVTDNIRLDDELANNIGEAFSIGNSTIMLVAWWHLIFQH